MKICIVDDCQKPARAGGDRYCAMHRKRLSRHGDLNADKKKSKTYPWIVSHKDFDAENCLEWPFGLNGYGYPLAFSGGRTYLACRVMCELNYGPPPTTTHHAAHSCHNTKCVNPKHLRWATPQENIADREARGTTARGERSGMAKLSTENARECKRRLASGETCASIGARFGVTKHAIWRIKNGTNWAWLDAQTIPSR